MIALSLSLYLLGAWMMAVMFAVISVVVSRSEPERDPNYGRIVWAVLLWPVVAIGLAVVGIAHAIRRLRG